MSHLRDFWQAEHRSLDHIRVESLEALVSSGVGFTIECRRSKDVFFSRSYCDDDKLSFLDWKMEHFMLDIYLLYSG